MLVTSAAGGAVFCVLLVLAQSLEAGEFVILVMEISTDILNLSHKLMSNRES